MFGKRKNRPWKRYASIERVEYNNGDVKYRTSPSISIIAPEAHGKFEALTDAEAHLDAWWADWCAKCGLLFPR